MLTEQQAVFKLRNKLLYLQQKDNLYEGDITGIANAVLDMSGKTWVNGYIVKDELVMAAYQHTTVPQTLLLKKSDIAVFRDQTSILEIYNNNDNEEEVPVVVIECKTEKNMATEGLDKCEAQLAKYVVGGEFPNGILMTEQRTYFYNYTGIGMNRNTNAMFNTITDSIQDIVNIIRSF